MSDPAFSGAHWRLPPLDQRRLDALIEGRRPPDPGMERHFVQVLAGEAHPLTDQERMWLVYARARRSAARPPDTQAQSLAAEVEDLRQTLKQAHHALRQAGQEHAAERERMHHTIETLYEKKAELEAHVQRQAQRLQALQDQLNGLRLTAPPQPRTAAPGDEARSLQDFCQACDRPVRACRCAA